MPGRFCQECGVPNDSSATTCAVCGATLKSGIPPAAPVPPPSPAGPAPEAPPAGEPPAYGPPAYAYPGAYIPDYTGIERVRQVSRTKWGVLVLAGAMLISLIPIFGLVCLSVVLFLVGIVLMAVGRKAFGDRHAKFVMAAVAFVIVYVALLVILTGWFVLTVYESAQTGDLSGLSTTFWAYLGGITAAGFLQALAWVLFVHDLENRTGRFLLYGALVALIVLQVAVILFLAPEINTFLAGIQSGSIHDINDPRILRLEGFSTTLSLVGAVPTILIAGAYILAYLRIERGEIPGEPAPAYPGPAAYPAPVPGAVGPPTSPSPPPDSGPPEGPPEFPPQ